MVVKGCTSVYNARLCKWPPYQCQSSSCQRQHCHNRMGHSNHAYSERGLFDNVLMMIVARRNPAQEHQAIRMAARARMFSLSRQK